MTWYQQKSSVLTSLNHVYGFSAFNVWAVGDGGVILHWDGQRWTRQTSGTSAQLRKIWGFDATSLWIAGGAGALLHSTDGGNTWSQVDTINNAITPGTHVNGEYRGIWGSSALDFWVMEDVEFGGNNTGFWHTTDGGKTFVLATVPPGSYVHIWGAAANYIIASGNFLGSAGGFEYYNGSGWAGLAETNGFFEYYGCWPYQGPTSAQNFTVGFVPTGAGGGSIADWAQDFSTRTRDVSPSGPLWRAVYGADLTNLYAAGAGGTGAANNGYALAKVVPPAGAPGVTGSWALQLMPPGLPTNPTGFGGVFADSSGYAVAVGAAGVIVAQPGPALSVVSAVAVAVNKVRVTLTTAPLAQSAAVDGDALNPNTWQISRTDTGQGFGVMTVVQIAPTVFDVVIYDRFAGYLVQHQVGAFGLLDAYGQYIVAPQTATFQGVLADSKATQDARAAANGYVLTDLANPPFPNRRNMGGGTRIIRASGDFASESGNALLRKLIVRRLTTQPGGFFHLPNYGVGLAVKEQIRDADLVALKKRIEDQVRLEPEVTGVQVALQIDDANGIVEVTMLVTTNTGQSVEVKTSQPLA